MNPNTGGEKPQSSTEAPALAPEHYNSDRNSQETLSINPENAASGQPATPVVIVPVSQPVAIPDDNQALTVSPDPISAGPAKAADRIEKIWVDRAKAIISQTRDDPFVQKKEMSKVKAEYIKKHFNKDVKMDDAVA